jgi:hypothetical protein
MSKYLDIERFEQSVNRHFGSESQRSERIVGVDRRHDSWYFDIVRFFGQAAIDPVAVQIQYDTTPFVQHDSVIAAFTDRIETALRAEGRLYDGPPAVQIARSDWLSETPFITIRPIRYGGQAAGFAMDFADPAFERSGGTLREYLRTNYRSTKLEDSPLCTGVGVCGLLIVCEADRKYLLRVTRSSKLASLENSVGPSAAGSVEFADDYRNLAELIEHSMGREIEEELGLERQEYLVRPVAYAREMVRGNRPQLFALVETVLDRSQIADRISALPADTREFSEFEFVPLHNSRLSEVDIAPLNFEAKMGYYLLEEWLDCAQHFE